MREQVRGMSSPRDLRGNSSWMRCRECAFHSVTAILNAVPLGAKAWICKITSLESV